MLRREPTFALGIRPAVMHSGEMSHVVESENSSWSRAKVRTLKRGSGEFLRSSNLRKLRSCKQVAAVCYRMRGDRIEFLLVRTSGSRRWTFPKGNVEPGMTHAQAAALEAFEEAGVHGRMEECSFTSYLSRKRSVDTGSRAADKKFMVYAHLCQVLRLGNPKELKRNRTWFSVEDARLQLQEGRRAHEGIELAAVVARALRRIQFLHATGNANTQQEESGVHAPQQDALQKIQFEAPLDMSQMPYFRRQAGARNASAPLVDTQVRKVLDCEILQFAPAQDANRPSEWVAQRKKPKALGTGAKG